MNDMNDTYSGRGTVSYVEQIRGLTASRDWWRRGWEREAAENEQLRQRITVLEGTAYLNAQPKPTQQGVRQAMGAAYASEDPASPRQRPVHVPLDNGA